MSRLTPVALLLLAACNGKATDSAGAGGGAGGPGGGGTDDSAGPTDDTGPAPVVACDKADAAPLDAETCVDAAACTWGGSQGYGYFGYAVAAGGDFDGDGHPDIAIGAPVEDVPDGTGGAVADGGRVSLLSGGRIGEESAGLLATFDGAEASAQVGNSLALPGDMDGDGLSELLVGARGVSPGGLLSAGAVYLIHGQPLGDASVSLTAGTRFTGESALARVGTTLAAPGDVDGDGLADALLQGELRVLEDDGDENYSAGRAYLVRGAAGMAADISLADADARLLAEGIRDAAGLGLAGGDLDGDGYADLVVGAPYANNARGRVYVLPGGPAAIAGDIALADAPVQLSGTSTYDAYGWTLAVGDVTGDGRADLAIGVPLDDPGDTPNAGRVHLHLGGPGATSTGLTHATTWTGDFDEQQLGTGLHMGADVDGDGTGDLLMGAVSAWRGLVTKGGRVYVAPGRTDGWPAMDSQAGSGPVALHGAGVEDYLGRATAAADIDGDGAAEVILGSGYTNQDAAFDVGAVYLFWGEPFVD